MSVPLADQVRFGDFRVDLRTGELFKNGKKVRLQIQPFQVLALLVQRPGELVSRDELRDKLWPDNTFVDFDDGLNTAVRKLRQVLCDSPELPQYIETLPRRGYGFIAPDDGSKDVFVHATALERSGIHSLREGQRVSFDVQTDPRSGKIAVSRISAE